MMAGHRFHPEKAEKLLDPKRKEIIAPERAIEILQIGTQDVIVDLGAGNGYFTVPMAKMTKEKVYAVDVQQEMLEFLKTHAEKEQVDNIEYILEDVSNTSLPSRLADKGLMSFVFHEVDDHDAVLAEIQRVMKPNGKFLIIEWEAVESEMGPPLHERIPSQQLLEYMKTKYQNVEFFSFHPTVYGILLTY